MFVQANSIYLTKSALLNLKRGEKLSINSGMGGSFTLVVESVCKDGIQFQNNKELPSYLRKVKFSISDGLKKLYFLLPTTEFGVKQQHIDIAKKAGYLTVDAISKAIADIPNQYEVTESFVKYSIKEHRLTV